MQLQLIFSGTNLTHPTRAKYLSSQAEQQNLNISGRQCFVQAHYRF